MIHFFGTTTTASIEDTETLNVFYEVGIEPLPPGDYSVALAARVTALNRAGRSDHLATDQIQITVEALPDPGTVPDPGECEPIGYGQTFEGRLSAGDRESSYLSGSYADCYTFSGTAGDRINILMSSDDFDTFLFLSDVAGQILALDDDGGDGFNSQILSFELPFSGTFIIEATSFSRAIGNYSLALTR